MNARCLKGDGQVDDMRNFDRSNYFLIRGAVLSSAVAGFFLAAHHAGAAALGAHELPLLVGRVGHFSHFNFAFPAEHEYLMSYKNKTRLITLNHQARFGETK
jgi:hypothetical protein